MSEFLNQAPKSNGSPLSASLLFGGESSPRVGQTYTFSEADIIAATVSNSDNPSLFLETETVFDNSGSEVGPGIYLASYGGQDVVAVASNDALGSRTFTFTLGEVALSDRFLLEQTFFNGLNVSDGSTRLKLETESSSYDVDTTGYELLNSAPVLTNTLDTNVLFGGDALKVGETYSFNEADLISASVTDSDSTLYFIDPEVIIGSYGGEDVVAVAEDGPLGNRTFTFTLGEDAVSDTFKLDQTSSGGFVVTDGFENVRLQYSDPSILVDLNGTALQNSALQVTSEANLGLLFEGSETVQVGKNYSFNEADLISATISDADSSDTLYIVPENDFDNLVFLGTYGEEIIYAAPDDGPLGSRNFTFTLGNTPVTDTFVIREFGFKGINVTDGTDTVKVEFGDLRQVEVVIGTPDFDSLSEVAGDGIQNDLQLDQLLGESGVTYSRVTDSAGNELEIVLDVYGNQSVFVTPEEGSGGTVETLSVYALDQNGQEYLAGSGSYGVVNADNTVVAASNVNSYTIGGGTDQDIFINATPEAVANSAGVVAELASPDRSLLGGFTIGEDLVISREDLLSVLESVDGNPIEISSGDVLGAIRVRGTDRSDVTFDEATGNYTISISDWEGALESGFGGIQLSFYIEPTTTDPDPTSSADRQPGDDYETGVRIYLYENETTPDPVIEAGIEGEDFVYDRLINSDNNRLARRGLTDSGDFWVRVKNGSDELIGNGQEIALIAGSEEFFSNGPTAQDIITGLSEGELVATNSFASYDGVRSIASFEAGSLDGLAQSSAEQGYDVNIARIDAVTFEVLGNEVTADLTASYSNFESNYNNSLSADNNFAYGDILAAQVDPLA